MAAGTTAAQVRCTGPDALSNLVATLELIADGQVRYNAATKRPLATTVTLVEDALVAGDYYDTGSSGKYDSASYTKGEPIAAYAWPLLAQAGGLARLNGTDLELTGRGVDALAKPGYETLARYGPGG